MSGRDEAVLRVEDLVVDFPLGQSGSVVQAVSGVTLDLMPGETLGLVGESGCGKTTTGRAILQVPSPTSGRVFLEGVDLTELDDDALRGIRPAVQMIFQDPMSSLNPRRSVRDIVAEPLYLLWEEQEGRPALSALAETYGRLFQRVVARLMAPVRFIMPLVVLSLVLWILSEAVEERAWEQELSWTQVPAQIIGFPVLTVVLLMLAVVLVLGAVWLVLIVAVPFGIASRQFGEVSDGVGLIEACGGLLISGFFLWRTWGSFGGWARWLNSGALAVLTLVLAVWVVASMLKPARSAGVGKAVLLAGIAGLELFYVAALDGNRKLVVLLVSIAADYFIFLFVGQRIQAAREARRRRAEPQVRQVLELVGINPDNALDRKPFEFSGGQAQRISIARALIMDPKIIICDEPVSALDVSVQAQILNLLEEMKDRYGLTLIFIAHDLGVVKQVSDRVAVMYLGKLCEIGGTEGLYGQPAHPYTELLLSAVPGAGGSAERSVPGLVGAELPSPVNPPSGCRFRTRCPRAEQRCTTEEPVMRPVGDGHHVACHFPLMGEVAP